MLKEITPARNESKYFASAMLIASKREGHDYEERKHKLPIDKQMIVAQTENYSLATFIV